MIGKSYPPEKFRSLSCFRQSVEAAKNSKLSRPERRSHLNRDEYSKASKGSVRSEFVRSPPVTCEAAITSTSATTEFRRCQPCSQEPVHSSSCCVSSSLRLPSFSLTRCLAAVDTPNISNNSNKDRLGSRNGLLKLSMHPARNICVRLLWHASQHLLIVPVPHQRTSNASYRTVKTTGLL
jgi:hypothetical protein